MSSRGSPLMARASLEASEKRVGESHIGLNTSVIGTWGKGFAFDIGQVLRFLGSFWRSKTFARLD